MICDFQVVTSTTIITLAWSLPKYYPEMYKVFAICESTNYVGKFIRSALSGDTSLNIKGQRSGSSCKLSFFAVYNRASLDSGIKLTVKLLSSGK